MKYFMYLLLVLPLLFVACGESKEEFKNLNVEEFAEFITDNPEVQLVDVRTPKEFAEGHIEGAMNIDIKSDDFAEAIKSLDESLPVAVYCKSGRRSAKASGIMTQKGFKVVNLLGGYVAWSKKYVKE